MKYNKTMIIKMFGVFLSELPIVFAFRCIVFCPYICMLIVQGSPISSVIHKHSYAIQPFSYQSNEFVHYTKKRDNHIFENQISSFSGTKIQGLTKTLWPSKINIM